MTMMYDYFEIYPADHRKGMDYIDKPIWHPLYFVEFTRWKRGDKMQWRLFKKCFIFSREEWNRKLLENPEELSMMTMTGNEGHPYQLSNGEVNENPGVIQMNTMEFLKYMVDALNDRAFHDELMAGLAQEIRDRSRLGDIIESHGMSLTPEQIENLPPELKKYVKPA